MGGVGPLCRALAPPFPSRHTRWCKASCFDQALLALAGLHRNKMFSQRGAGFGTPWAAWRHVNETLDVLVSWAPAPPRP
ncbi:hypothetical protein Sfulv_59850 [Streptomyces fulvorobeus]|uniref:Transposase n=1 Tax=Streptomyces fulvorobeus TaxID=284028 RepID=A0A7J0CHB4_9ACTN|nr:hypothetical protein [Streptomyces fulvorobeus]NYE44627.1 hypothetical protein [Streptomyces fulvorobeus]GFN01175.1 hypothetical protein Sfulv_59850 [Streptomyces fulvorobeus]